jgi:hypothetical protein
MQSGVRDSFRTSDHRKKDGGWMDINLEGESPHDGQVPPVAPEAAPVTAPTTFTTPKSRSEYRFIPFALLGIVSIGTGLAAFFAVRESTAPSEAVASALTNSLQFKTAATTISIGIKEPGGTAMITSEGVTNFDTAATKQVEQIVSGNEHIEEHIVGDGSENYVHLDGGIIAKVVAGKSWVSLPSGQSAASGVTGGGGTGNTAAILRVLSATGNDVSDLGSSRVNGQDVHLYAVHLTRSQINQDIAQEHLPQYIRQAIALVQIPAITYTLAINGTNQLTQMKAILHLQADGQQVTEHLTEGYSSYGTKVTVTAPPPHEVIPFQTFLQIAQERGVRVTI